jgi:plasmid stabilization system protein ParE
VTAAAEEITAAARAWLDGLDGTQRAKAVFPFDTNERFVWAYTPGTREGLAIRDMRPDQRRAATAILGAALSERTEGEVGTIMGLETVLGALEREAGRGGWTRRDPELYWFAVFGDPDPRAPWSWRIGGHHVAIHVTLADGQVIGSTPSFLGANPAVVPAGPQAGFRALAGEEMLARTLLAGLTPEERKAAIVDDRAPADILTEHAPRADTRSIPVGIPYRDLSVTARADLERLIRHYIDRGRPQIAAGEWERIATAGLDDVTFAWAGPVEPGHGHYYAIRGPRLLIEYDNTQNDANHIHAVRRDLDNDWGEDLLARHYAAAHSGE